MTALAARGAGERGHRCCSRCRACTFGAAATLLPPPAPVCRRPPPATRCCAPPIVGQPRAALTTSTTSCRPPPTPRCAVLALLVLAAACTAHARPERLVMEGGKKKLLSTLSPNPTGVVPATGKVSGGGAARPASVPTGTTLIDTTGQPAFNGFFVANYILASAVVRTGTASQVRAPQGWGRVVPPVPPAPAQLPVPQAGLASSAPTAVLAAPCCVPRGTCWAPSPPWCNAGRRRAP